MRIFKHLGPGPHPDGTPQSIHGGKSTDFASGKTPAGQQWYASENGMAQENQPGSGVFDGEADSEPFAGKSAAEVSDLLNIAIAPAAAPPAQRPAERASPAAIQSWVVGESARLTPAQRRDGYERIRDRVKITPAMVLGKTPPSVASAVGHAYLRDYGKGIKPQKLVQLYYGAHSMAVSMGNAHPIGKHYAALADFFATQAHQAAKGGRAVKSLEGNEMTLKDDVFAAVRQL